MDRRITSTALGPTFVVAVEQLASGSDRLLDDRFAIGLLPLWHRLLLRSMKRLNLQHAFIRRMERTIPGLYAGILCRKLAIDEAVATASPGISSVLHLGAGLDARAMRMGFGAAVPFYEIDDPFVLEQKRRRLPPDSSGIADIRYVALDLSENRLVTALKALGFNFGQPSFVVMEGLTQYLDPELLERVFHSLARLAPGSRLAFTYVTEQFLSGEEMGANKRLHAKYVKSWGIWKSALEPETIADWLRAHGWKLESDLAPAELPAYRAICEKRGLQLTSMERLAVATR